MGSSKVLIAFDLDGTLNQTDLYALKAYRKTFEDMGIGPFRDDEILSRFGAKFEEDVAYFFGRDDEELSKEYERILSRYWQPYMIAYAKPYPHVPQVLAQLKQEGYLLSVCSNAPFHEIISTLDILGLSDYFSYIQGIEGFETKADALHHLIQEVQPMKSIMVGDRWYDQHAAKMNHIAFIGCGYGFGREELRQEPYVMEDIRELCEIVKVI